MNHIPPDFQTSLWSYNVSKLDKDRNSSLIITQLLNYGGTKGENWILANYSDKRIKEVLMHPQRGVWERSALKKWLNYFDMLIDPLEFEAAVKNLMAPPSLIEEVWKRKLSNFHGFLHTNS